MRKEAREKFEKSLMSVKKKKSWGWTAKSENASFSSNKGKLEGIHLYDVSKVFLNTFAKELSRQ